MKRPLSQNSLLKRLTLRTNLVVISFALIYCSASHGQILTNDDVVSEDWVKHWPAMGAASSLATDEEGNVYVTGAKPGVVKYNAAGMQQWALKYNPNAFRVGGLAVDAAGNVYLAKTSYNDNASYPDENYVIKKLDALGAQQWQVVYDNIEENDVVRDIAVDAEGNVLVTGISLDYSLTEFRFHYDYATVNYDSLGQEQWVARYDGGEEFNDFVTDLEIDAAGNIYVSGYSEGATVTYTTIKYNALGEEQWVAKYEGDGIGNSFARDLALDAQGNVYVTGNSEGSEGGMDVVTIKYNSSGAEQWISRYNGPENTDDEAYSLRVDEMGNVYVAGNAAASRVSCAQAGHWTIIKYNASGVEEWVTTYEGTSNPAIGLDEDSNVYVTGGAFDSSCAQTDVATVKWNSSGMKLWEVTYDGPQSGDDYGTSLLVDGSGNIYVAGSSEANGAQDMLTIRYSQETGTGLIANNDAYETDESTPLDVAAPGVLANDAGAADAVLTASLVEEPANGSLIFYENGAFIYTPDSAFIGIDSFTYKVIADTVESNIATVSITVNPGGGGNLVIHKINAPHMPYKINAEIGASAIYTGSDIVSGTWYWGDGSSSTGSIEDSLISGSHSYNTAGIYNLSLTISNTQGDSASLKENFVVVYDPNVEFAAGVGTFYSPAGSYLQSLSAEGNVYFAFGIPATDSEKTRGKLLFRSASGNIRFLGTSFEDMFIAGDTARIQGTGMMNDQPNHSFILSVVEFGNRDDADYIRLQVWDENEALVYDNQMGDAVDAIARTPIIKGTIIVNAIDKTANAHPEHLLSQFQVYPVPVVRNELWLRIPALKEGKSFTAAIYDTKGRKMVEKQLITRQGQDMIYQWHLPDTSWPSGIYIISLEGAGILKQWRIKK